VQAKDWKTAVKKSDVAEFWAILNDLPGQPRGIMIARSGFQKGAVTFAKAHGIALKNVDYLPKMNLTLDVYSTAQMEILNAKQGRLLWRATVRTPEFSHLHIEVDKTLYAATDPPPKSEIRVNPLEMNVIDASGTVISTLLKVFQALGQRAEPPSKHPTTARHDFEGGQFISDKTGSIMLPVKSLSATVIISERIEQTLLKKPGVVDLILTDLVEEHARLVSITGDKAGAF
jgi:hypothetical protein